MIEQEMASIIQFVQDNADGPELYYWDVPEDFIFPAAYFPPPEIESSGETFRTYGIDFSWFIKLFHNTSQGAYARGFSVLSAIRANRNLIPLLAEGGEVIANDWVRVNDPKLRVIDDGVAQLTIHWRSRRPYNYKEPPKMQSFDIKAYMKSGKSTKPSHTGGSGNTGNAGNTGGTGSAGNMGNTNDNDNTENPGGCTCGNGCNCGHLVC